MRCSHVPFAVGRRRRAGGASWWWPIVLPLTVALAFGPIAFGDASPTTIIAPTQHGAAGARIPVIPPAPGTELTRSSSAPEAAPGFYQLQFNQTGAPASATWWVNISSGPSLSAAGSQPNVTTTVANGTYNYSVGISSELFWSIEPAANGSANVSGADVNVTLAFVALPTFPLQFNQTGAPPDSQWYVNVSREGYTWNISESGSLSDAVLDFPNGTYEWATSIDLVNWIAVPASGSAGVHGVAGYVDIDYYLPTYVVQFNQSGVPSGLAWWVNITDGPSLEGSGADPNVYALLAPGTYDWNASTSSAEFTLRPASGTITVTDAPLFVDLVIHALVYYPATFDAIGVPASAIWWVNLTQGTHLEATGTISSLIVDLYNGTYGWTAAISTRNWSASPASGSFSVAGAAWATMISFSVESGNLTFRASGLPSGTLWFANVTSVADLWGTTASLAVTAPYGTYTYRVACSNSSWAPEAYGGTFAVGTSNTTVNVTFAPVLYAIRITPIVLGASPADWSVEVGTLVSVSGAVATVFANATNGTYEFSVTVPGGFTVDPASGSLVVAGAPKYLDVVISQPAAPSPGPSSWGPFGMGWSGYVYLAAIAAAMGLCVLYVVLQLRPPPVEEEPPPAAPPAPPPPPPDFRGYR